MARTKNRGLQQSFSPSYTVRRWRLGEYIRLSKEDLKKGKDDSNSVINQRDLLNDFYQKHIGEFESVSEYVDDGHTGTDANRENFQRLLSDVMSGKINCVVVKDLSRFARNYSDAGSLIDNLFVQMGVRFISLAENVDSYLNPDSVSSIIVPITNVMKPAIISDTLVKTVADLLDEIENETLYRALLTVDRRTLQIILLKMQGYSTKEIAPLVGLTTGAIYARLDHLRKKLRKIL